MKQSIAIWLDAARPKTLPLALVSITTGSSLAYANGHFSFAITALALLTAIFLQILSNLANDFGDTLKGTDNEQRLGPTRAMQSGAVSTQEMKKAIIINIVLTIISGLALVLYSLDSFSNILTFIGLGLLAILSSIAYTMGSKPYGYVGLGDLSVFIFFGLLGVGGTFFLHTGAVNLDILIPAIGCGLLAVAVLNINNMRDIENDEACGKRTVAVRLGQQSAKYYHIVLIGVAFCSFVYYLYTHSTTIWIIVPFFLSAITLFKHGREVLESSSPLLIAPMMPTIVKCASITNILFSLIVVAQTLTR
ncbi:1,4-dihydroxy-2-naphthoate octaprenyltransferase [Vibrio sp. MACH09]|uniref:1,4-dihydroxy-2-naphthoate polyprenyltransferase n=1 Tax=unclassified Vibrio TaxID=2614977 RepID=UPI001493B708|nr:MULTISPECIES: 1,4-dihydroxy-2-naphthoate polyprenyltransferase [unclassified Vibrio]NOI66235.1 1,4-dihydroxy-2-naphthoate polyprenyltransferase [Vibrio sp. 99-8-1]GLO62161.1 1,4-dihydroxy-2-naphthoate octaprenyltransferase [Vibrio sp. MACH09]